MSPSVRRIFKTPLGTAVEISTELFLQRLLPPLRHNLDPAIVDTRLRSTGEGESPIILQGRWQGFAQDPAEMKCRAQHAFRNLPEIVTAIVKAGRVGTGQFSSAIAFENNPNSEMEYLNRSALEANFPDAFLYQGGRPSWDNLIVSGEHKKSDEEEEVVDNSYKVVASMSRCMCRDPRRRFTFGYTIESSSMRLWYCDRSEIVVSESFNFVTDREPMIHFFLSLIYAEPQELGWDLSMISLDNGAQYDIRVDGINGTTQIYRTLELLSGSALEDVRYGGTRVWKAVRIEDGKECGEAVVLKDAWVDADSVAEGVILEKIRGFDCEPNKRKFVDTTFPTLLLHGDVFLDLDRTTLDCTRSLSPDISGVVCANDISRKRFPISSGEHSKLETQVSEPSEYGKVHYRIVLKEVGRPISQEESPAVIFKMLAQIAFGLQHIHRAGWVHHDISLGNIVIVNKRAMILDMEYAKEADQEGDRCIGTPGFIAAEVDHRAYFFRTYDYPSPKNEFTMSHEQLEDWINGKTPPASVLPRTPSPIPIPPRYPLRFSALHDLESLWWVAVYFVFKRQVFDTSKDADAQALPVSDAQQVSAEQLFHDRNERHSVITDTGVFTLHAQHVHPTLQLLVKHLGKLRGSLVNAYKKAEQNLPSPELDPHIHDRFITGFVRMGSGNWSHIKLRPLAPLDLYGNPIPPEEPIEPQAPAPISRGTKRAASESVEDEQASRATPAMLANTTRARAKRIRPLVRTRPYLSRKAKARQQHEPST